MRLVDAAGPVLGTYTYAFDGRQTVATDPEGHRSETYLASGGLRNTDSTAAVSGADRLTTRYRRDGFGRVTRVVNVEGDSTVVAYDDLDRVQWSRGLAGDTTRFTWDGLRLAEVRDAMGQTYSTLYNALGWVTRETDPRGKVTLYYYDRAGNVTLVKNIAGQFVHFAYDSLGQVSSRVVGSDTTWFWTDPAGLREASWNAVSRDTVVYDAAGRVTQQVSWRGATRYAVETSYDTRGLPRRSHMSSPATISHELWYTWDGEGRLATLQEDQFGSKVLARLGYNADRQVDSVQLAPTARTYEYAGFHPPVRIAYSDPLLDQRFGERIYLDQTNARIARVRYAGAGQSSPDTVRRYAFDEARRLTGYADSVHVFGAEDCVSVPTWGEWCEPGFSEWAAVPGAEGSWTYDAVGNRTGAGIAVDLGNLLAAADPFTFVYDQAGRTIEKRRTGFVQTFHWNAIGQLDSVVTNGAVTRMRYDGFGRRVRREGPSGTEQYVWDGDDLHLILDGTGAVKAKLTCYPGIDAPHSLQIGFERYHYALDHAGNVIGLFDDDGNVAGRYRYDPWGRPQGAALDSVYNPLRFQAREWDEETGLYYVRARYYDPDTGRFLSPDPIGLEGGINPYVFAGNDPVHLRDPSGLQEVYIGTRQCRVLETTFSNDGQVVDGELRISSEVYCWNVYFFGSDDSGGPSGVGAPPRSGPGVRAPSGGGSHGDGPSCGLATASFYVTVAIDIATVVTVAPAAGRVIYAGGRVLFKGGLAAESSYRAARALYVQQSRPVSAIRFSNSRSYNMTAYGSVFRPNDEGWFMGGLKAVGRAFPGFATYFAWRDAKEACQ
ncbi:MAG: RHS repeat-associated core domain-containing protein [Gemmatimonadota bacterium]|nr:RHS repeat-associated core domain-containing protein [Gemmatimonadota bacterium]